MTTLIEEVLRQYYSRTTVRQRMVDSLGSSRLEDSTAVFLMGSDGYTDNGVQTTPDRLFELLEAGLDVERSLWDRKSLIADLDIDYQNFDSAVEPHLNPEIAFALEEPVVQSVLRILGQAGIRPLHVVSGRGHHLLWAVHCGSRAFASLAALGRLPTGLVARYAERGVELDLGRAFDGLGMVLEHLGHLVLASTHRQTLAPVELMSVEVGPGIRAREVIPLDLSEYGDPLDSRHIRIPFSAYLKPRRFVWALGEEGVSQLLPVFAIPLGEGGLRAAITAMRNPEAVVELSRTASTVIPDQSSGMESLIASYRQSDLAEFHRWFYAFPQSENAAVELPGILPPCTAWMLDNPNDWLLRPGAVQNVVRVFLALGWHPRSIAELIRSRYEEDHGWGDFWLSHDPEQRALFYTRLFAGLIATGRDELIDLNCVSEQEKGYCTFSECSCNLVPYQQSALQRREYDRLGCGPFNRLLLANEHL